MPNRFSLNNFPALSVFLVFMTIYTFISPGKITTSMDVDVRNYSKNLIDNGELGSKLKLSSGVSYSSYTGKFYPQEGVGIIASHAVISWISGIITPESDFLFYLSGSLFLALTMMFMFKTFRIFLSYRLALLAIAVSGLATPIFVHSKYFFPEPLLMLCMSITIYNYFRIFFTESGNARNYIYLGSSLGATLLCRPDSPIFVGLFSLLILFKLSKFLKNENMIKNILTGFTSFALMLLIFFITNQIRYGKITETGYTLSRVETITALENDLNNLKPAFEKLTLKATNAYQTDKESTETIKLVKAYQHDAQEINGKEKFLAELKKQEKEYGNKNTSFTSNGIANYFYGIYLILFNPSRSIFFLSPVLILLVFAKISFYRIFKTESVFFGLIFFAYLSLYALRAPLSYSGSAAWGVRYMLPMFLFILLLLIPFFKGKRGIFYNKTVQKLFFVLFAVSVLFQVIGSAVSYQSVQMPLEYACKQKFGTNDMTWAHESRKELMTSFRGSLLYNNFFIAFGELPPVLNFFLPEHIISQIKQSGQLSDGINDWYFLNVLTSDQDKSILFLFFIFLLLGGYSVLNIYKQIILEKKT